MKKVAGDKVSSKSTRHIYAVANLQWNSNPSGRSWEGGGVATLLVPFAVEIGISSASIDLSIPSVGFSAHVQSITSCELDLVFLDSRFCLNTLVPLQCILQINLHCHCMRLA